VDLFCRDKVTQIDVVKVVHKLYFWSSQSWAINSRASPLHCSANTLKMQALAPYEYVD